MEIGKQKRILAIGYYNQGRTILIMNNNIHKTIESKEIFIGQLPNSLTKSRLELFVKYPDESCIVVVARLSPEYNDWLAYIGYPNIEDLKEELKDSLSITYHCETIGTNLEVLAKGDLLDADTARALFPNWSHLKYRME